MTKRPLIFIAFFIAALLAGAAALYFQEQRESAESVSSSFPAEGEMLESIVRRFLYYPTRLPANAPLPYWIVGAKEVFMDADGGLKIHALYWPADEGRPTILFLHGNAQTVFEWALIREELEDLDCGLLLLDYPGYGKSTGSPNEETNYSAGRAAFAWLKNQGIDAKQIVFFGKSLGGGVVTELAKDTAVHAVILESTFTSIPAVAQRLMPMIPVGSVFKSEIYDSLAKIRLVHSPVLVVHGTRDGLIPVEEGKKLFEAANEPKELYLVPGADHNDVSMTAGTAYGRTLRNWLDKAGPSGS